MNALRIDQLGMLRDQMIVLRLDDEHVAAERGASRQCTILFRHDPSAAQLIEQIAIQLTLGHHPVIVAVQRRNPHSQPLHRPHSCQQRRQVAAIAGSHHSDGGRIDMRMLRQQIVGGQQIIQILLAGDGLLLGQRQGMPPQVEGQADAAQARDATGTRQVTLLAAPPAMHEQHPRQLGGR